MHREVKDWLRLLWDTHPALFHGRRVLECGSRMVPGGGTVSGFFADCEYTGLDAIAGQGVDVVGLAHEYQPDHPFDVVVSCQMLEHDPNWRESVAHMVEMVAPGGALLLTFPDDGWPMHGDDYTPIPGYYHNPDKDEIAAMIAPAFDQIECTTERLTVLILATGKSE